ncbi:glycosyltransferase 87 family protein [Ignisphaera sp. 4213-co]|uniref:Glycosyltransferase 87 family protein n=1 Tax=Ignisphaera cupida TaxID=3050454 RepID=A0ABD4Z7F0_9CREN|nr:glycosyltransferase 87 family protein [Ignisphaera sp. 4213-co]MDK6028800.1 glycosyltransferase 87 family protein [Ignisphaera sp. 4213-co]
MVSLLKRFSLYSIAIAITGFVVRLLIALEGVHGTDILFHVEGVKSLLSSESPYCLAKYNYPPLYAYIQLIGIAVFGWNPLGYKFSSILFDTLLALLLYHVLKSLGVGEKHSLLVEAIWCFNPLAIAASAWYGLFDSIPTFFVVLAIHLLNKSREYPSSVFLALGVLTKVFPLILLPTTLLAIATSRNVGKASKILAYIIIFAFAVLVVEAVASFKCVNSSFENQIMFHISREDKGLSPIPQYPYSQIASAL